MQKIMCVFVGLKSNLTRISRINRVEKSLGLAELSFCMNIALLLISILGIICWKNGLKVSELLSLHTSFLGVGRTEEVMTWRYSDL